MIGISPSIGDAKSFVIDFIRAPRTDDYSSYGYEIYMPNLIAAYIAEIEKSSEHPNDIYGGQRVTDISPIFLEAAWELCRQGILRPGIKRFGLQSTADGASGYGYSVTASGRRWISEGPDSLILIDSGRLARLFETLSLRFGSGYLQRAGEASHCYSSGLYLACCAMAGAAAESILLAVAVAKTGDEADVLSTYRGAQGRRKIIECIVGNLRKPIAEQFKTATGLLAYWRDESAHGLASTISEIEAHEAIARLIRFSQFGNDNWNEITAH